MKTTKILYEKTEIENINILVDYLIEIADIGDKLENQKQGKTGEGFYTHHLKEIKKILDKGTIYDD